MDANGNSEAQSGWGSGFFMGLTASTMIEISEVTLHYEKGKAWADIK